MVTRKDLVIAVLCTFCLTTTLFTIKPITSSSEAGDYDPWLDYNDDGKINLKDIGASARAFGAEGNTTRNVTVTNFPIEPEPKIITVCENLSLSEEIYHFEKINVEDYQYVSIFGQYHRTWATDDAWVYCSPSCSNITGAASSRYDYYGRNLQMTEVSIWETRVSTGFEVGAPYLDLEVLTQHSDLELTIVLYCYN